MQSKQSQKIEQMFEQMFNILLNKCAIVGLSTVSGQLSAS